MFQNRIKKNRFSIMLFAYLFLYGCTGGFSCGGNTNSGGVSTGCLNKYPYPQSGLSNGVAIVSQSAQIRMTEAALDFLESHIKDILIQQLESTSSSDGLIAVELPPTQITASVSLGEGQNEIYPTKILIDTNVLSEKMKIRMVQAGEHVVVADVTHTINKDGVLIEFFDLPVGLDARLFTEVFKNSFNATAACQVVGANPDYCGVDNPDCGIFTGISVAMLVFPEIKESPECNIADSECLLLNTEVLDAELGSIGAASLDIYVPPFDDDDCNSIVAPENCSPECSDINFAESAIGWSPAWECTTICAVEEFGIDFALGVGSFIQPLLASQLDSMLQTSIDNALKNIHGAPLSIANRFILADKLVGLPPVDTLDLGFAINPEENSFAVSCPDGGDCSAEKGMDLFFKTGFEAAIDQESLDDLATFGRVPHSCTKPLVGQDFISFFRNNEFVVSNPLPLKGRFEGEKYHFGISLSTAALEQAFFAIYNAGFLCFDVSSDEVYALSQGGFALAAGSIDILAGGQLSEFTEASAPARLTLVPSQPPKLRLKKNEAGNHVLHLDWKRVQTSFYTLAHQRFVRIFGVSIDLAMDFEIVFDQDAGLLKVVMTEAPQINNYDQIYNELLPEENFAQVLESLVALGIDAAFSEDISFDLDLGGPLGDALGFPLATKFHGIEMLPEDSPEYIQLYLSLLDITETNVEETNVNSSENMTFGAKWGGGASRLIVKKTLLYSKKKEDLVIDLSGISDGKVQVGDGVYVQTDFGGYYGPYTVDADFRIKFKSPKLNLVGEHQLRFKLKGAAQKYALQKLPLLLRVASDFSRPKVSLRKVAGHFEAQAHDDSCAEQRLQYAWQIDDQDFGEYSPDKMFNGDLKDVKRLSVKARDCHDRESFVKTLILSKK